MKRRIDAYVAVILRVGGFVLALWFAAMLVLTLGAAWDMQRQLQSKQIEAGNSLAYNTQGGDGTLPGFKEYRIVESTGWLYFSLDIERTYPFMLPQRPGSMSSRDWFWGKWDLLYGFEAAAVYYDDNGEPLVAAGDKMAILYTTQEKWDAGEEAQDCGYAWIDLSETEAGIDFADRFIYNSPVFADITYFLEVMRLRGYFDGNEFIPVTIDAITYGDIPSHTGRDTEKSLSDYDRENKLPWRTVYSAPSNGTELVTIYGFEPVGQNYDDNTPFRAGGKQFDSLTDWLLKQHGQGPGQGAGRSTRGNLFQTIMLDERGTFAYAVRFWPLPYAALRLIPTYLVSLVIVLAVLFLVLRGIRVQLIEPVRQVNLLAAGLPIPDGKPYEPRWKEPYETEVHFKRLDQQLRELKAHNRQLQTALDYARDAEAYRRRMISGLTHELKTPLAVIHSYAEGLKEGIAKEKTEQYLDVILQESEWMDAMVLQMLDLSRLEAGKVRLSTEQFSLSELTRSVFDKLMPLAEEKELTVEFNMVSDCVITADESRIRQVVTNLASNAIKYTPAGGKIVVIAYQKKGEHYLSVENTCQRLSEEALTRVWDSFYRGDAARTTEGTGLGLTVVKTIVELHGGTCRVFNTPTGVQFQIILP